jgi:hypothetical protein
VLLQETSCLEARGSGELAVQLHSDSCHGSSRKCACR